MRWVLLFSGALLALMAGAEARMHAGPNVLTAGHRLQGSTGAPLDGLTAPSSAYSLRRLRSAYTANKAIRLLRASDSAEQDIGFLGFVPGSGAPLDYAQANAFCAAATCKVKVWYDQVGARNLTRSDALFPAWSNACTGITGGACIATDATSGYQILSSPTTFTPTSPMSFSSVARRAAGSPECKLVRQFPNDNQLTAAAANQWIVSNGAAMIISAATDGVWHAGSGVINGTSSVIRIDATETAGTVTANVAAGADLSGIFVAPPGSVCNTVEAIYWDGYAATATERAALTANQRNYWGLP